MGVRNLSSRRRDGTTGDRQTWLLPDAPWDAFQGSDHHPIDEEAFLRIVGREDLVRRFHREATVKKSLTIGGGAVLAGGLLFAGIAEVLQRSTTYGAADVFTDDGAPSSSGVSPGWGLAIAATGLVALVVGHFLDPIPIDADEADALARGYDQSLRARLGLSETASRQ